MKSEPSPRPSTISRIRSNGSQFFKRYILFIMNAILFLGAIGLLLLAVYSLNNQSAFNWLALASNLKNKLDFTDGMSIPHPLQNPSIWLFLTGVILWVISLIGLIGALLQNQFFLRVYTYIVMALAFAMFAGTFVVIFYHDQIRSSNALRKIIIQAIRQYRVGPDDISEMLDWLQHDFGKCCGANSPVDWDLNVYFKCNSSQAAEEVIQIIQKRNIFLSEKRIKAIRSDKSVDACSVPWSCCFNGRNNTLCGRNYLKIDRFQKSSNIHLRGCIDAAFDKLRSYSTLLLVIVILVNLIPLVAGCISLRLLNSR
ncbi:hypothetical protein ACOME3_004774 [Neoechinorhynchus agilis]